MAQVVDMSVHCDFSKVAFRVFGLPIYWYALAYIAGILSALHLGKVYLKKTHSTIAPEKLDIFINYAVVGIVMGGRLGHVLFYNFAYYCDNPLEIFQIWHGGMSFFGGFAGVVLVAYFFCKKHHIDMLEFTDLWSVGAPIGLFLGRLANFVNGELVGKASSVAWGVVFSDGIQRHPSQIYEAFLEGIVLFAVMIISFHRRSYELCGKLSGIFCGTYGVLRFVAEFFREPDSNFSQLLLHKTAINFNQYICVGIFILGYVVVGMHRRLKPPTMRVTES
ncbi:MAG: prolipoprotein diacylglyceryl transferase [Holosporaceae bacterium]|jgi:phosphatidylglycerol:prolipoprotein diacylglycerol transferase|nr:prolipoprotein diacylglyceryl transferase [Holosporaceae bacterium]